MNDKIIREVFKTCRLHFTWFWLVIYGMSFFIFGTKGIWYLLFLDLMTIPCGFLFALMTGLDEFNISIRIFHFKPVIIKVFDEKNSLK